MKLHEIIALLVLCAIVVLSCGGQKEWSRELKLSLILGENSDWYRGTVRFRELVEERTADRYRIKIFPLAQLAGNQRTKLEMLQSGVIDMSMESSITFISLKLLELHLININRLNENRFNCHYSEKI